MINNFESFENSVSVIIPFFNGNKYLQQALQSVEKNISYVKEVVLVVDRGSNNPNLTKEYNFTTTVLHNESDVSGAGVVRAQGFNFATGRFVAFLDCDDIWHEKKLERQISNMLEERLVFSFHSFKHFSENNNKEYPIIIPRGPFTLDNFLSKKFTIGCLTVMIDKEKIQQLPTNILKRRNDYKMWHDLIIEIESRELAWGGINIFSASHRLHDNSLTSSRILSAYYQYLFLNACGIGLIQKMRYFVLYAFRSIGSR